jgi:hypothetical protein
MAKSDLLKEAIADAKAVKETALANAKLALQEAFQPRVEAMLSAKLREELEDEEEVDVTADATGDVDVAVGDEMGADMGADMGAGMPSSVNVGLDFNDDGEYDLTGLVGGTEEVAADEEEVEAGEEDLAAAAAPDASEDDLNLEEILRELEMGAEEDVPMDPTKELAAEGYSEESEESEEADISEIIEAILRETEMAGDPAMAEPEAEKIEELEAEKEEMGAQLEEAYKTVKYLKSVINEVNLLNAKLLYTNKLFRNFELSESQKMKVIENFDRAASTREAKLVFATLAESFKRPTTSRRAIKESKMTTRPNASASRAAVGTAPSKQTTQILSEGFEYANRWKKLAGLI